VVVARLGCYSVHCYLIISVSGQPVGPFKMGLIGCHESVVSNYQSVLYNMPEE